MLFEILEIHFQKVLEILFSNIYIKVGIMCINKQILYYKKCLILFGKAFSLEII